jgi:hypothetical protein
MKNLRPAQRPKQSRKSAVSAQLCTPVDRKPELARYFARAITSVFLAYSVMVCVIPLVFPDAPVKHLYGLWLACLLVIAVMLWADRLRQ